MSSEHHLAREARRELLRALEVWVMSLRSRTLTPEEIALRDKAITYFKLKRITGRYHFPEPEKKG